MALWNNTRPPAAPLARQAPARRGDAAPGLEIEKIVVVTKKTPLVELVNRLNSKSQAQFYLEQNQVSFADYEQGDAQYQRALEAIKAQLPSTVKQQFIDRDFLPTFQFGERDLVVTVG